MAIEISKNNSKPKRILFLGSKNYGIVALRAIQDVAPRSLIGIITLDDSGDDRSRYTEIRSLASTSGITLKVISKTSELREAIIACQPDLCFTVGWFTIIPDDVLQSVPDGFVGIHNSLLPSLRGSAPFVWAILKGHPSAGITLFKFGRGLDNGDILASKSFPILSDDYIADVMEKAENLIVPLVQENFPLLLQGVLMGVPQSDDDPRLTFGAPRRPPDGNIDWFKPAGYIYNFIRAQSYPYQGAFTYHQDRKMIIRRASLFPPVYYGTPGQIAQIVADGVYVICGDDRALILNEIELHEQSGEIVYQGNPNQIIKSVAIRFSNTVQNPLGIIRNS
jgi:methionyl-tRNA formyltransferase